MTIRLVVVEDHDDYRRYLARELKHQADFEVVDEVSDGADALRAVEAAMPVVVMDIQMAGDGGIVCGISGTRELVAKYPHIRVLALSAHDDPAFVAAMFKAGALGYAHKDDPMPELIRAIREVAAGREYRSPSLSKRNTD